MMTDDDDDDDDDNDDGPVDHVGRGSAGVVDLRQTVHLCNNHTIMTW